MKFHKKILAGMLSLGILTTSISGLAYGQTNDDIKVMLDGKQLSFDVNPVIHNDRTLVPFRVIFEKLGVNVDWDNDTRTVTAEGNDVNIELTIDKDTAKINGKDVKLDAPAKIYDDRTMVPVRIVTEAMGCTVDWVNATRTVIIETEDTLNENGVFTLRGINLGDDLSKVESRLGKPDRVDDSKYGFDWYIYNSDYFKYVQVGIKNDKVVGIYSNADVINSNKGIDIGTSKIAVNEALGEGLDSIKKGNTAYEIDKKGSDTYLLDGAYTTVFYDMTDGGTVTSIMMIDKEVEESYDGYYGQKSEGLIKSYEMQILDITNSLRTRMGLKPFEYSKEASAVARKHSIDMAERNFMKHNNPDNKSPFDRMRDGGLEFRAAAENIAAGQPSAIQAHEGWMNSEGHRKNIVGNYEKLGIGVEFGGSYGVYYTENFYSEK